MLHIGICDDEEKMRDNLYLALNKLFRTENSSQEIELFSSGQALIDYIDQHPHELDAVFLDIQMPQMDGMETAVRIREQDQTLLLVFLTSFDEYVFDGYKVDAFDYILKPITREKLESLYGRLLGALKSQENDCYLLENKEGLYRIPKSDILYCFSTRRIITLVTAKKEYRFYGRLDETALALGKSFIRIHQRYLVRAKSINHVEGNQISVQGQKLPISRANYAQVMAVLVQELLT